MNRLLQEVLWCRRGEREMWDKERTGCREERKSMLSLPKNGSVDKQLVCRPRPPTPVIAMTAFEDIIPTPHPSDSTRPSSTSTVHDTFSKLHDAAAHVHDFFVVWETSRPALTVHVRHPTQRGFSIVLFPRTSLPFVSLLIQVQKTSALLHSCRTSPS